MSKLYIAIALFTLGFFGSLLAMGVAAWQGRAGVSLAALANSIFMLYLLGSTLNILKRYQRD